MTVSRKKRLDDPFYALKSLLKQRGDVPTFQTEIASRLFDVMSGGSIPSPTEPTNFDDRALAILYASQVEQALEDAVISRFVCDHEHAQRLFSYNDDGPLCTFASKVSIGLAVGLFGKPMFDDLKLYNAIRNCFAHARVHVDFHSEQVGLACSKLSTAKFNVGEKPGIPARGKYYLCSIMFVNILHGLTQSPDQFYAHALYKTLYNEPPPSPKK